MIIIRMFRMNVFSLCIFTYANFKSFFPHVRPSTISEGDKQRDDRNKLNERMSKCEWDEIYNSRILSVRCASIKEKMDGTLRNRHTRTILCDTPRTNERCATFQKRLLLLFVNEHTHSYAYLQCIIYIKHWWCGRRKWHGGSQA